MQKDANKTLFAELIRIKRLKHGLSIREAAAKLNVNKTTLQRWENGETSPQAAKMLKIIDAFGIGEAEFAALFNPKESHALGASTTPNDIDFLEFSNFPEIYRRLQDVLKTNVQAEVARALGFKPQYFHQVLKSTEVPDGKKRKLPFEALLRLAYKHGVDIHWLLTGETPDQEKITPEVKALLDKTRTVLESEGPFAEALSKNIEVFHLSVSAGVGRPARVIKCKECLWVGSDPLTESREGKTTAMCPKCRTEIILDDDGLKEEFATARDLFEDADDISDGERKTSS